MEVLIGKPVQVIHACTAQLHMSCYSYVHSFRIMSLNVFFGNVTLNEKVSSLYNPFRTLSYLGSLCL